MVNRLGFNNENNFLDCKRRMSLLSIYNYKSIRIRNMHFKQKIITYMCEYKLNMYIIKDIKMPTQ